MKKKYKKLLNKKDPVDKEILKLVKKKKLKIGITKLKGKKDEKNNNNNKRKNIHKQ